MKGKKALKIYAARVHLKIYLLTIFGYHMWAIYQSVLVYTPF